MRLSKHLAQFGTNYIVPGKIEFNIIWQTQI